MPSGGAPPYAGSGLAELELIEDGDTSSTSLRISGTAALRYGGLDVTAFYDNGFNGPAYAWQADNLAGNFGWRVSESAANNSSKYGTKFGVPLYQRLSDYPSLPVRHRRYRYGAILTRSAVAAGGSCGLGLFQPTANSGVQLGAERGIELRSLDTLYGGAWHLAWRWYPADGVSVGPSSGLVPAGAALAVEFDYRTGPGAASLVVTLNGMALGAFDAADLPLLGPDGANVAMMPGFYSRTGGGGGHMHVGASHFRQDRVG